MRPVRAGRPTRSPILNSETFCLAVGELTLVGVEQSRRGRTRSEEARAAILRATRDELTANGYDKLSIDRVAAAAGAGKQTVYRWYPAKSALVADCIIGGYLLSDLDEVVDAEGPRGGGRGDHEKQDGCEPGERRHVITRGLERATSA